MVPGAIQITVGLEYSLKILGSGSAKPVCDRFQTSQILQMRDKQFLIDCGEGTQIRLSQFKARTSRLNHIFISHLHGDHCLGLVGLLSTFGMLGRVSDIVIHSHPDLERLIGEQIKTHLDGAMYKVHFEAFDPGKVAVIYEDRTVKVTTLPLKHTVPTCGFLFEEKPLRRHIKKEMCQAYEVPIAFYKNLQAGEDFVTEDGEVVDNARLTTDPRQPKRFAYMSDTAYSEKNLELIKGVDILYHEATYLSSTDEIKLRTRMHSSAAQAANLAKLAGVKKLVIGHYSSSYATVEQFEQEARTVFPESYAALDGSVYEL